MGGGVGRETPRWEETGEGQEWEAQGGRGRGRSGKGRGWGGRRRLAGTEPRAVGRGLGGGWRKEAGDELRDRRAVLGQEGQGAGRTAPAKEPRTCQKTEAGPSGTPCPTPLTPS